jgi:hypothetical protein
VTHQVPVSCARTRPESATRSVPRPPAATPLVRLALATIVLTTLALTSIGLRAQTAPGPARGGGNSPTSAGATQASSEPADALAGALTAACLQDADTFSTFLTAPNAAAFRTLPDAQRTALLRRFVLLDDPGKPLLSKSDAGRPVLRCEAGGVVSEVRFGATESLDNLAFIPVEIPQAADEAHSVRFGMVREAGAWKILSLGLLLLDVPALEQQWQADELVSRESDAISAMQKIADALKGYQSAYGKLPETLDELGPPPGEGASPEQAGLLDKDLAAGKTADYSIRYTIVPAAEEGDESERNKTAGFTLAAAPLEYGKTGKRSFCLDAAGLLHGADKQGAVATSTDPRVE